MLVDFSKINIRERPFLILKSISGTPLGVLGAATNVVTDIKYNEVSTLDFDIPSCANGIDVPNYDNVTGMKIVELQDVGQFILMNPKETGTGIKRSKACNAYSLEYEFTFKKIALQNGTYNFWDPVSQSDTVLGVILELMPSWKVGTVDSSLVGKYRTFEVSEENLYNFMKNTLQQSYNCIFDFDTYNRVINVRDVSSAVPINPIYISLDNLAKEISVEEDTENIITRLDVNGADGVDIRDVNPMGTNKIINLDYYMTTDNFEQSTINKYNNWKDLYEGYQLTYYNLSIEYSLQIMRKTTEAAALTELEGELVSLENQQAVTISAIAQNLDIQASLDAINSQISSKQAEINTQKKKIQSIQNEVDNIMSELVKINKATNFQNCFTADEYIAIDRFIKDDAVTESSFVAQETSSYNDDDFGNKITSQTLSIVKATISTITGSGNKSICEIRGGTLNIGDVKNANIIHAVCERNTDETFVMTAYMGKGSVKGVSYETACLSLSGSCSKLSTSDTTLIVESIDAYLYLTLNTTEYAKRAVAWDLYEYGKEVLEKVSQPSFKFSVSSANFIYIEDFECFKNSLNMGERLYVGLSDEQILSPVVIGVKLDYDSAQSLSLEFSDTYVSGDSSFLLADLLEQSVSMGKNVDTSKFTYSAFVDSGANTQVRTFMNSALDVAKNAIISSKDQAITWGESGIRLRKWTDSSRTSYDPHQVWMNNNSILMTSNNWATAEIAIGNFYDKNLGNLWGVVAPNIVGTLLAGSNLVIESTKKDGSVAVFRVDADGCYLHNSELSITSESTKTQILLDAQHGIALGKYPLVNSANSINKDNAKFWVDENGNLFFSGTLQATVGEFSGKVTATSGYIGGSTGWTIESTYIYNGKPSYSSTSPGVYIGTDGIALGDSSHYVKASKNGQLICNNILAEGGTVGGWTINDYKIYAGDGVSVKTAAIQSPSSTIEWVFAAGGSKHSGYEDCPFRVNKSGKLYATGADISGAITATSGNIGGCTISEGALQIKNANIESLSVGKLTGGINTADITFNGTFTAPNAVISGKMTATSGYIGSTKGWAIESTYIYNGKPSYSSNNAGVYIGTDGISLGDSSCYVRASKNGQLSCNSILASGGTIGGWTINGWKIYAGDGVNVKTAAVQTPASNTEWVFAAGGTSHDSYKDCPFRVHKDGTLYATGANISGTITATKGNIGSWIVGYDTDFEQSIIRSPKSQYLTISDRGTIMTGYLFTVLGDWGLGYILKYESDYSSATLRVMKYTYGVTVRSSDSSGDDSGGTLI